jgi:DNA-binding MurR/RpiR family transcriptional regulator
MKAFDRIPHNQQKFLTAYLPSRSISEACQKAGLSESTAYRYLNDPRFQVEYKKLRHRIIDKSLHRLQSLSEQAVTELDNILKDEASAGQTKLGAAKLILEMCSKTLETEKLEERLSQLESRLEFYEKHSGSNHFS